MGLGDGQAVDGQGVGGGGGGGGGGGAMVGGQQYCCLADTQVE